jgi:hypothetical protein
MVVVDTLQKVTNHFGIKKTNGQLHELNQKIRNQRDVDSGTQVQQYPPPYKIDSGLTKKEHKLP